MTIVQYSKVELCGMNTSRLRVMTEEEKMECLRTLHGDDPEAAKRARQEMVEGNLRLVLSVIQRFSGRSDNPDDLFQVGCIGLMKAIDHFDMNQGVRFSTYGVPMIIGEIRRYLRDNNSVRVSRSLRDLAYKAMQMKEKLTREMDREPTVEEIAKGLCNRETDSAEPTIKVVPPGLNKQDITPEKRSVKDYEQIIGEGGAE